MVNSDCRMTGTVAFKTFQRRQSESREWSLHLIPISHLGLFLRVEWVGIVTDKFTMELFGTLVLIISPITRLYRGMGLNSFPKQVPWCNSIKTLIQSATKPQNGYQIVFNHVIVFTHMKVYIWGECNPHRICLYTTDSCFIVLYAYMARGAGKRGWRNFFSCGNNCFYSFSTQPLVRGTARPQTQQSLISYTANLCVVTQRFSPLPEDTKNRWPQTHRTWVEKRMWTIVFVGLGLVTYWNSLCPRLEKWKLCR